MLISYIRARRTLFVLYLLLVLGLLFAWWFRQVYLSPQRVFNAMLGQNLSSNSFTRHLVKNQNGQTVDQTIYTRTDKNASLWSATITQGSDKVTTESIGTPSAVYVQYTSITKEGKPVAAAIAALHTWAKATSKDQGVSDLYAQALLDVYTAPVPPIGQVKPAEGSALLDTAKKNHIFTPDYSKVTRSSINGKKVYVYPVAVNLEQYVKLMQLFANDFSLSSLSSVQSDQYHGAKPVQIQVSIDPVSRHMVRVAFPVAKFTEDYTEWGSDKPLTIPQKTITFTELQSKLDAAHLQ